MENRIRQNVKNNLYKAAISYSFLLNKRIILKSPNFEQNNTYIIRFFKSNFAHLTGVKTTLLKEQFYQKCLEQNLDDSDFDCDSSNELKNFVKIKLRHLVNISEIFKNGVFVQESFKKGSIICNIATSDGKCTIGFVDAKFHLRPKTILDKNCLDKESKIIYVVPIIE